MCDTSHFLGRLLISRRLFHLFVNKFSEFSFLQAFSEKSSATAENSIIHIYEDEDDLDQCLYYLRTLSNILRWSSDSMWTALSKNTISTDPTKLTLYRISKHLFP